jgi:glycosyltransferase involved in cell wall biosynthesis
MKRILHISNYYPPHAGGIENVCRSIVVGLPAYHRRVICFNDRPADRAELCEGIPVMRCGRVSKLSGQALSLSFYGRLKNLFAEFKPDIVHFHAPNPLAGVCLLRLLPAGTGLVVHWHSDIVAQEFLYPFYRPAEETLLRRADRILVTSPAYASCSQPLSAWKNKLQVIPNTVDVEKFAPQENDRKAIEAVRARYDGKKIVFAFGRHVPYKGFSCLIDATPYIDDGCAIVIAGTGPLTGRLKKATAARNVHFAGKLDAADLRRHLYASCLFAFPSVTRNEAFGIALAEAMYCGLPAATFTVSGSGVNWVCPDGETGLESENGNPKALAEAINRLLEDAPLREKLSAGAKERVRRLFVMEAVKEDLEKVYNSF